MEAVQKSVIPTEEEARWQFYEVGLAKGWLVRTASGLLSEPDPTLMALLRIEQRMRKWDAYGIEPTRGERP